MKVTIKEVAKEAGVSIATVSRVLNRKGGIKGETVDKVQMAIEKLHYHPDLIARTMIVKETKTVGLVVPKLSNEYWALLSELIQEELWDSGYSLVLCSTDRQIDKERAFMKMFVERQVDGIIYGGLPMNHFRSHEDYTHIERVKERNIPIISFDPNVPGIPCVVGDHLQGAFDAVEHLIRLGHQRIAYIGGPAVGVERELGYRKAFMMNGYPIDEKLMVIGPSESMDFGFAGMTELIASGEPFTAVFCGNDMIALGVMKAAYNAGLQLPEDLAIVGYDDINLAGLFKPMLTTVRQPMRDMSKSVVRELSQIMEDPSLIHVAKKYVFPMELVIRESCGMKKTEHHP
jgi:LacI family transcriptional regulator